MRPLRLQLLIIMSTVMLLYPEKSSAGELVCEEEQESLDMEINQLIASAHLLRIKLMDLQQLDQDFAQVLDRMEDDRSAAAFEITKSKLALTADSLQQTAKIFCGNMSTFGKDQTKFLGEVCEMSQKVIEAAYTLKSSAECAGGNGTKCLQAASWVSKQRGKALSNIDLQIAGTVGSLGTNAHKAAEGDPYAGFKAGEDVCDIPGTMGDKKATEACKTAVRGTRIIHNAVEYGKTDKLGEELDESLERQIQKAQEKRRQIQAKEEILRLHIADMNAALAPIVQGQLFKKEVTHSLRCDPEKDKSVLDLESEVDRMVNVPDEEGNLSELGSRAESRTQNGLLRSFRDQLRSYRNLRALSESSRPQREAPATPSAGRNAPPPMKWPSCPDLCTVSASGQGCDCKGKDFEISLPGYNNSRYPDAKSAPGDKRR